MGKVTQSPGQRCAAALLQVLSTGSRARGVPFGCGAACCLHALGRLPRGRVPPGVPCASARVLGGRVWWRSLLPDGDSGPPKPVRNTPACVGKVSGCAGGGKAGSLLSRASAERGCLVRGFLPVSLLPDLPSSPPPRARCRGLRARRGRARDVAAAAPLSGTEDTPLLCPRPWGSRSRRVAAGPRAPVARPGRGARLAQGQPPAPGAAPSGGTSDAAAVPALPRGLPSVACLLLPRPRRPQRVDALGLREGMDISPLPTPFLL